MAFIHIYAGGGIVSQAASRAICGAAFSGNLHGSIHFISTPAIKATRANFIASAVACLPALDHPLRIMDIGTGDGSLLVELLTAARAKGTLRNLGEVLLIDASPAMIAHATTTVAGAFPATPVRSITARFEQVAAQLDATCYTDQYFDMFTLHYGRDQKQRIWPRSHPRHSAGLADASQDTKKHQTQSLFSIDIVCRLRCLCGHRPL
jgi:SAM-dependent MidA family methyltransferase